MSPRARRLMLGAAIGLTLAIPGRAAPSDPAKDASLGDYFSPADVDRSRLYRGPRYTLFFAGLGAETLALVAVGIGPGLRKLGSTATRLGGTRWWVQLLVLACALQMILILVRLPFAIGRERHDRTWGLSTRDWGVFSSDTARATMFELGLTLVAALGFFALVRALPRGWPFAAAAGAAGLTVALSLLWPVIYEPLFNRFTPVDAALRERIVGLGEVSGVRIGSVLVADASRRTTTQNAYVSGLGATKRVVLYDTLLEKSSPEEVDLVVAHELAHVRHRDVLKGTALGAAGAAVMVALVWLLLSRPGLRSGLGIESAADHRALPFLMLVGALATLVSLPIANGYSRTIEAAADRAAVRVTQKPEVAVAVEVNLARDNISDLQPNGFIRWALFSHPAPLERIAIALDEGAKLPGRR